MGQVLPCVVCSQVHLVITVNYILVVFISFAVVTLNVTAPE